MLTDDVLMFDDTDFDTEFLKDIDIDAETVELEAHCDNLAQTQLENSQEQLSDEELLDDELLEDDAMGDIEDKSENGRFVPFYLLLGFDANLNRLFTIRRLEDFVLDFLKQLSQAMPHPQDSENKEKPKRRVSIHLADRRKPVMPDRCAYILYSLERQSIYTSN
jgi:hypothetical protein